MIAIAHQRSAGRVLAGVAGGVAVAALLAFRLAGDDGFATDPVGVLALAAGATGAAVAAARLAGVGNRRAGRLATWLCASLLAYLVLAAWAVWAVTTGHSTAALVVAAWNRRGSRRSPSCGSPHPRPSGPAQGHPGRTRSWRGDRHGHARQRAC
ncbi:hypothetical protein [Microbispora sp. ATCC PTA-5024]|uniref:hypothetical protein n=1 Tax=Microbispora sp. ATCC PTA-5024 TaxID=316330 RepID=UPI0012ECE9D3|nr:hypothetical protein [Microbispora sp. ATCC PTA-5024]